MTFDPGYGAPTNQQQPSNNGDSGTPPAQWPPAPTVWPPPTGGMAYSPPVIHPFKFVYAKTVGNIADFREGSIGVDQNGVTIQGRVQPRAEIYQPILAITFVLVCWLAIIPHLIMRYGCLSPAVCFLPWDCVQSITTAPNKRKICIAYTALNYAGRQMNFSLAMQFTPNDYASLSSRLDGCRPGFAKPGKIRPGASLLILVLYAVPILLCAVIAIGAMKFLGQPSHP